jgi:hypothetical protein
MQRYYLRQVVLGHVIGINQSLVELLRVEVFDDALHQQPHRVVVKEVGQKAHPQSTIPHQSSPTTSGFLVAILQYCHGVLVKEDQGGSLFAIQPLSLCPLQLRRILCL